MIKKKRSDRRLIFRFTKRLLRKAENLKKANFPASPPKLFTSITIETTAHCNRKCTFCYNNFDRFPRKRDLGIMEEETWIKIIDELSLLNYSGRISPHFYGEPLLDKRILQFVTYAREKCPEAYIRIHSNGDMLTETLLQGLIKCGLNTILMTNYDDSKKPYLERLAQQYEDYVIYRAHTDFTLKKKDGTSYDAETPCLRPTSQMVINWKGNVLLCCNDYYEEYVLGNIKDASLLKIWNSKKFQKYRRILSKKGGRTKIALCKRCD